MSCLTALLYAIHGHSIGSFLTFVLLRAPSVGRCNNASYPCFLQKGAGFGSGGDGGPVPIHNPCWAADEARGKATPLVHGIQS